MLEIGAGPDIDGWRRFQFAAPDRVPVAQRAGIEPVVGALPEVPHQLGQDAVEIDGRKVYPLPASIFGASPAAAPALSGASHTPV